MSAVANSTTSASGSVKPPLGLKKKSWTKRQLQLPNFQIGVQGETRAKRYLVAQGLVILAQNITTPKCEVDILARDPQSNLIVAIEVKTRQSADFGHPSEVVSARKLARMRQLAWQFMRERGWQGEVRVDVVCVLPDRIEWLVGVGE